jgi:hypothetical protein
MAGDVFQIPVGDDRLAHGQVLSTEDSLVHLVLFDGVYDIGGEHDLDAVLQGPVMLYAWTNDELFGKALGGRSARHGRLEREASGRVRRDGRT